MKPTVNRVALIGLIVCCGTIFSVPSLFAAGGLFPKMPAATNAYMISCNPDSKAGKRTAWALQGLINRSNAEVYIISSAEHGEQLEFCKKPNTPLWRPKGDDPGLRGLFRKYKNRVKKMFLYDPEKDWTWYLAMMSGAQQDGIPVTESIADNLKSEFGWTGEVVDFRNKWTNRIEAYEWGLTDLMPGCNTQVVFQLDMDKRLCDYVVATRGFNFWLNEKIPAERAETEKIYRAKGYGLGSTLMGYHHDAANEIANPLGIGYVASDYYGNGSFWSSFPNKTYTQARGKAIRAEPGKIYVSIMWSDGDNIQFDQGALFNFWHDPARGTIPVATPLSPTLQELNSPLLDWYYSHMTTNDELIGGPTGVQFINVNDFSERLFPAWCQLTHEWCSDAGFHFVRIWRGKNPSTKFDIYMKTCGFDGVLGEGGMIRQGYPPKLDSFWADDEEKLYERFTNAVKPKPSDPVFVNFTAIVKGFNKKDGGYTALKRQIDRLKAAYPGRYVFLLPKDQFAAIRAYYHLPPSP